MIFPAVDEKKIGAKILVQIGCEAAWIARARPGLVDDLTLLAGEEKWG
jgi:hypothetical protein